MKTYQQNPSMARVCLHCGQPRDDHQWNEGAQALACRTTYRHCGLDFAIVAEYPDTQEGTAQANAFMTENANTGVLAVTGRISGDDEDTLLLLTAENHDQAAEGFKAELRAIRNVDPEDQDDTEIFIGAVVWSATPIQK